MDVSLQDCTIVEQCPVVRLIWVQVMKPAEIHCRMLAQFRSEKKHDSINGLKGLSFKTERLSVTNETCSGWLSALCGQDHIEKGLNFFLISFIPDLMLYDYHIFGLVHFWKEKKKAPCSHSFTSDSEVMKVMQNWFWEQPKKLVISKSERSYWNNVRSALTCWGNGLKKQYNHYIHFFTVTGLKEYVAFTFLFSLVYFPMLCFQPCQELWPGLHQILFVF